MKCENIKEIGGEYEKTKEDNISNNSNDSNIIKTINNKSCNSRE